MTRFGDYSKYNVISKSLSRSTKIDKSVNELLRKDVYGVCLENFINLELCNFKKLSAKNFKDNLNKTINLNITALKTYFY